jgi:hypothetical protein
MEGYAFLWFQKEAYIHALALHSVSSAPHRKDWAAVCDIQNALPEFFQENHIKRLVTRGEAIS